MSYEIKTIPEDFIVKEMSTIQPKAEGTFTYFLLRKKNETTLGALQKLSKALALPLNALSCAGNKDRRAITEQVCSAKIGKPRWERLGIQGIEITVLGFGDEPVHLGQLAGNRFELVVRNLDDLPEIKPRFVNLFGEQRFSKKNADIGRALVKRDFKLAAELMELTEHTINAIRQVPRKLLLLYVHAYQSLLWNQLALEFAKTHKENLLVPIIGFGTTDLDDCALGILEQEGISQRDFIIRELPEISAEGGERWLYAEATEVVVGQLEDDDLHPGRKKVKLSFTLPKGSYATEFIRQLFL